MSHSIVFTGGGTAGHVTPNIALIAELAAQKWTINYIGSTDGVEKNMIGAINIPYHAVRCGKLRRYFSWKNVYDPINMLIGIVQAYFILRHLKPNIVFSKGGFVAFPVVVGAWLNRIPIVAHESDMSPGLANRLSFPFVNTICVTFAAALKHFKQVDKVEITGTPIRRELLMGEKGLGLARCGFNDTLPCLMIVGGSQGSNAINSCVRNLLDSLTKHFQVIHLCGKGNLDTALINKKGYAQFEYANEELPDLFAASDLVVSRAGANALYEILVLEKPHILIPLSRRASRGDQIQNARYFQQQGISVVIDEEMLTPDILKAAIHDTFNQRNTIVSKIHGLKIESATLKITEIIKKHV